MNNQLILQIILFILSSISVIFLSYVWIDIFSNSYNSWNFVKFVISVFIFILILLIIRFMLALIQDWQEKIRYRRQK